MIRELKKQLKQSLEMEEQLVELVEQCLKELFKENGQRAVSYFNEYYETYEYNGYLQSVEGIKKRINQDLEHYKKWKADQENNNAQQENKT